MKKTVALFAVILLSTSMLFAQQVRINFDVLSGRRPPNPAELSAMRGEEAAHPSIAQAMHKVEDSLNILQTQAASDFGGYKVAAITNLQNALYSLRKCLYFRIYQDTH